MTQSERATTRISARLADFISALSENENAATRALMLIGADQLGIDPTLVADDLRLTMAARLPPDVYTKLQTMWNRVDQSAVPSDTRQQAGTLPRRARTLASPPMVLAEATEPAAIREPLDPFSNLGFDFDETA